MSDDMTLTPSYQSDFKNVMIHGNVVKTVDFVLNEEIRCLICDHKAKHHDGSGCVWISPLGSRIYICDCKATYSEVIKQYKKTGIDYSFDLL